MRRGAAWVGLAGALVGVLTLAVTPLPASAQEPPAPPVTSGALTVVSSIPDGSTVPASSVLKVGVRNGTLSALEVSGGPLPVSGTIESGQWTATSALSPGASYRVGVRALTLGPRGSVVVTERSFRFRTSPSSKRLAIDVTPNDSVTVGVAQPVALRFNVPVGPRSTVAMRLTVASDPQVMGAWRWVSPYELRWRPESYWAPGTKVRVSGDLRGLDLGGGVYAVGVLDQSFTVGRQAVVKLNAKTKQGKVIVSGKTVKRFPISLGKPGFVTRSGVKVVMERYKVKRMRSNQVGESYDLDVPYALRLTWSGEFLHAAPWASGRLGRYNGSHGCSNVSMDTGRWLFGHLLQGDPVVTTGTSRKMDVANGYGDWNVSLAQYASLPPALTKPLA